MRFSDKNFWNRKEIIEAFKLKAPSKYIVDSIDKYISKDFICIDVGCGAGRYSNYMKDKCKEIIAIDKHKGMVEMVKSLEIKALQADMSKLPLADFSIDMALSIGVIHNSISMKTYIDAISELARVLKNSGILICSIFTDDIIGKDLHKIEGNLYLIENKPPMVLMSKDEIIKVFQNIGFKLIEIIDEHVTNVGTGERNVFSCVFKKE